MNPETMLDTVGKGCVVATKFQEILQKVFGPKWTRKQADADAYADGRKLQTIRENPDMEIIYTKDGMSARKRTPEALAYRVEQRMANEAIQQQENLENVFEKTANDLAYSTEAANGTVDDDWITRFTSIVKDVSSKEMQQIWSKILAGEIQFPGSFSLRTLETVRNLSQREAATFQKIMPYILNEHTNLFLPSIDKMNEKYCISKSDIMLLMECGLLSPGGTVTFKHSINKEKIKLAHNRNYIIVAYSCGDKDINISYGGYSLTRAGKELYSILNYKPDTNYYLAFAEHLAVKRTKMRITVHKIKEIQDTAILYEKKVIKEY